MKCLNCDKKSLATIVDHICVECMDMYVFCPDCIPVGDEIQEGIKIAESARRGHVDLENQYMTAYKFKLWYQSREAWKRRIESWEAKKPLL